jgi:cell pole-organizing protein PopZ
MMGWLRLLGGRAGSPEGDEFPGGNDVTTEPREQQEPSMEEILSSIRRIIADEEATEASAAELGAAELGSEGSDDDAEAIARATEDDADPDEDVLELTRVVRESGEVVELQSERSSPGPAFEDGGPPEAAYADEGGEQESARPHHDSGGIRQTAAQIGAPQSKDKHVPSEQAARNAELLSGSAASVATGAFAKLSQALQRTPEEESVADRAGRTVEQFIEDIARPMLKEWLDEYLPAIVERLVQKEIQKISRRAELN